MWSVIAAEQDIKIICHSEGDKVLALLPQVSTVEGVAGQNDLTIIRGQNVLVDHDH